MRQYLDLLKHVKDNGQIRTDRTGTGTRSVFGYSNKYDLSEGFPAVTTKKVHFKSVIHEIIWFLSGDTNIKYLQDNKVRIWNEWADEEGNLGPVYGKQWRSWSKPNGETVDQIQRAVDTLKNNPYSRRIIVNAWNAGELDEMALTPCHCLFQFYARQVEGGFALDCQLYQRSADAFLGVPFNISSYALLMHMMAQVCGMEAGVFTHTFGDLHIYSDHEAQTDLQLTREPLPLPKIRLNPEIKHIDDFKYEDVEILDYQHHPHIKGKVSV